MTDKTEVKSILQHIEQEYPSMIVIWAHLRSFRPRITYLHHYDSEQNFVIRCDFCFSSIICNLHLIVLHFEQIKLGTAGFIFPQLDITI